MIHCRLALLFAFLLDSTFGLPAFHLLSKPTNSSNSTVPPSVQTCDSRLPVRYNDNIDFPIIKFLNWSVELLNADKTSSCVNSRPSLPLSGIVRFENLSVDIERRPVNSQNVYLNLTILKTSSVSTTLCYVGEPKIPNLPFNCSFHVCSMSEILCEILEFPSVYTWKTLSKALNETFALPNLPKEYLVGTWSFIAHFDELIGGHWSPGGYFAIDNLEIHGETDDNTSSTNDKTKLDDKSISDTKTKADNASESAVVIFSNFCLGFMCFMVVFAFAVLGFRAFYTKQ
ncbi:hypothetical protein L596_027308 [Steinernema carpocapsae]|uniref:Uncharacterized protein n=1 Tax=Steinernema carpocapsae TaxID=34508 RepID=A0A4U5M5A7_STECR|nr:hypothetical protein L596_027308 [Steinernema carpocapsae]